MPGFRSPLDAYREDLSRATGRKRLAADDEFWIVLATGMRRLAQAPSRSRPAAARRLATALVTFAEQIRKLNAASPATNEAEPRADSFRPMAVAEALQHFPDADWACALVTQVRGVAADAEEVGGLTLAREILSDLRLLSIHAPALDQGTVLLQLGRIARTVGDLDGALDFLHAAGNLGRAEGVPELVVRESLGAGVIARTRGNYPSARELFETALDGGNSLDLADVVGMSHQGLMIVAAEAGDFDAALTHGWQAYSAARTQGSREAEALGNLSQLCAKAGYDAAALAGFLRALALTNAPRLRLPILGGVATCAARLGDVDGVTAAARAIAAESNDALPFETSGAWFSVSRAQRALGDVAASDAAAHRAAATARAHGFYELTHRLEQAPPVRAALADSGLGVIKSLEAWSGDAFAESMVSTSSTD